MNNITPKRARPQNRQIDRLDEAVHEGSALRVRPILMTTTTTIMALLPIMLGSGTGSETMRRIAAPMLEGTVSAILLTLVVLPVVFALVRSVALRRGPAGVELGGD